MKTTDIAAALARAARGDRQAQQTLFEDCWGPLHAWARRRLGQHLGRQLVGPQSASDFVQETLQRAEAHFSSFKGHSWAALMTWLRHIAKNLITDALRHERAAKRSPIPTVEPPPPLPDQRLASVQLQARMLRGVVLLPERQGLAVWLGHVAALSHRQVAALLGCPSTTAASSLMRTGLAAMRARLAAAPSAQDLQLEEQLAQCLLQGRRGEPVPVAQQPAAVQRCLLWLQHVAALLGRDPLSDG